MTLDKTGPRFDQQIKQLGWTQREGYTPWLLKWRMWMSFYPIHSAAEEFLTRFGGLQLDLDSERISLTGPSSLLVLSNTSPFDCPKYGGGRKSGRCRRDVEFLSRFGELPCLVATANSLIWAGTPDNRGFLYICADGKAILVVATWDVLYLADSVYDIIEFMLSRGVDCDNVTENIIDRKEKLVRELCDLGLLPLYR
ncbi:MAG: SUKH-3 domain-containing protein, partial [Planctomycetaceae bacterium]|nr:SUKH-3 domain-containing protein [Planctomycetaceae bacterium]